MTEREIVRCEQIWVVLGGNKVCLLDTSEADRASLRTRFNQLREIVLLGADAIPGIGIHARSRMSEMACLAHELSHAQRFYMGIDRPTERPDVFLDEAEASLHASFLSPISFTDRQDLVEDARLQIATWQDYTANQGEENEC
ncbi:MAG: hypothetical protein ACRYFS_21215 [Janthinobacterium lividum]